MNLYLEHANCSYSIEQRLQLVITNQSKPPSFEYSSFTCPPIPPDQVIDFCVPACQFSPPFGEVISNGKKIENVSSLSSKNVGFEVSVTLILH